MQGTESQDFNAHNPLSKNSCGQNAVEQAAAAHNELPPSIAAKNLCTGYGKKIIVSGLTISIEPGKIITLIGPNGSGKSTVLKTLTAQLRAMGGTVSVMGKAISSIKNSVLAKKIAMVTTERIKPECMTCRDVVATGRYPHTGYLGLLSPEDYKKVDEAMELVHAAEVAHKNFNLISDG